MPTQIENVSGAPAALPYPLRGVLAPGQRVVVNLTKQETLSILGTSNGLRLHSVSGAASEFYTGFANTGLPPEELEPSSSIGDVLTTIADSPTEAAWEPSGGGGSDLSNLTTGLLTGGVITQGSAADQVNISAGTGIIIDYTDPGNPVRTPVAWSDVVDFTIPDFATNQFAYFTFDITGTLSATVGAAVGDAARRSNIQVGWAVFLDSLVIDTLNSQPDLAYNASQDVKALTRRVQPSVQSGFGVTGTGTLAMDIDEGSYWSEGSNYHTDPNNPSVSTRAAESPATITLFHGDGVEGGATIIDAINVTLLDPLNYDNAGTLDGVPQNNDVTIQRLYMTTSGRLFVAYGQEFFTNFSDALAAVGDETFLESALTQQATLLGRWVLQRDTASTTAEAQYFPATSGSSISGGGGTSPVFSVFGRLGNVIAALNDYSSSLIQNLAGFGGATVTTALQFLQALNQVATADTDGSLIINSGTTFVETQTVNIVVPTGGGTYEITWYQEFINSDVGISSEHRCQVDNTELIGTMRHGFEVDTIDTSSFQGSAVRSLTAGSHDIDMDSAAVGSGSVTVSRRRITVRRIS